MPEQNGFNTLTKNLHSENSSTSHDAVVNCPLSWESLLSPAQNQQPDYWGSSHGFVGQNGERCVGETSSACKISWGDLPVFGQNQQSDYLVSSHSHGGRSTEWCIGESSSSTARQRGVSDERKLEQEQHVDSSKAPMLDVSGNSRRTNGFLFNSSSEALTQDLNASARFEDYNVDRTWASRTFESSDVHPYGRSSSSFNLIDSQLRPQKRKASDISFPLPRENNGLILNNESGNTNSMIPIQGSVSANPPLFTASERAESSSRSFHQHGHRSLSQFSTGVNVRDVESSSSEHSSRLTIQNYPRLGNVIHNEHSVFHPTPWRGNDQSRFDSASSRRTSISSFSSRARNSTVSTNSPRSISDPMLLPGERIVNSSEQPVSWSTPANVGAIAPSPFSSSGLSLRNSSRYHQRLSELRRSLLTSVSSGSSAISSINHSLQAPNSSPSQGIPVTPSLPRRHSNSRAAQLQRLFEASSMTPTSEGRRNITSEIRRVLDLMLRGERLRVEDMMILDRSVLLGMANLQHDRHHDMRMDVDNMSYEELLALEERIGSVCTGLSEETIAKHLEKRIYIEKGRSEENEPCCICREEYIVGDDVGKLDCSHDFHSNCIKQWLLQKNMCPICKTTGLKTRND